MLKNKISKYIKVTSKTILVLNLYTIEQHADVLSDFQIPTPRNEVQKELKIMTQVTLTKLTAHFVGD